MWVMAEGPAAKAARTIRTICLPVSEGVPFCTLARVFGRNHMFWYRTELSIVENFSRKTALSDLLGVPEEKVYDNRLYRALDKLLPHKAEHVRARLIARYVAGRKGVV